MTTIRRYQDLIVWQKSMILVTEIYRHTSNFPKVEMYGLVSQMRRAAVSVPSNIAEGQARNSKGEFRQFLGISKGSLAELETLTLLSKKMEYIHKEICNSLLALCSVINRLLNGLLRSLSK